MFWVQAPALVVPPLLLLELLDEEEVLVTEVPLVVTVTVPELLEVVALMPVEPVVEVQAGDGLDEVDLGCLPQCSRR